MLQSNGRGFARSISSRTAQPHRLRGLLVGTALGGSLAVLAAAAPTPAKAECAGPPEAVICTAGEYSQISYSVDGLLNVALESGVVVNAPILGLTAVQLWGGGDLHFSAETDTSINGWGGTGLYLHSAGGSITADSEHATGVASGIRAFAPTGMVTIHSVLAEKTGPYILQAAIQAEGFTGVLIEAVDSVATGEASHGIVGTSDGGTVSIVSTGEVSNDGAVAGVGIGGVGRFGVTIDSNVVRTEGGYAFALIDLPGLDVELGEFVASVGIHGRSYEGDVAITSGDILTSGDGAIGIYARARAGDVAIDSTKVATSGHGATGILVNAAGKVDITSAEVTTGGDLLGSVDEPVMFDGRAVVADAIHATSTGDAITITSGTASASGAAARGIDAKTQSGAITIDAELTTTSGDGATVPQVLFGDFVIGSLRWADAIHAESNSGAIVITSEEAHATGAYSTAIFATTQTGSVEITSGTATGVAGGIVGRAFNGTVNIDSGSVEVAGQDGLLLSSGITALGRDGVTIKSGTVITHSSASYGIHGSADDFLAVANGAVHIESDSVTTTGQAGGGIGGFAQGDVTIDSGTITTTGAAMEASDLDGSIYLTYPSLGLIADSVAGDVAITSGSISTQGDLAFALRGRAEAGAVTIASGSVATAGNGAAGVIGIGSGAVSITSEAASTAGDTRWVTGVLSVGDRTIYRDEIAYADAIHAESTGDAVTITSGTASASGAAARGIDAKTQSGAITIDAGLTTTSGDGGIVDGALSFFGFRTADAIHAESVSGAIVITSEEAHASGASSAAIYAVTQTGSIEISSGTATGVTGGIIGNAFGGTVSIDSGSVEVAGQEGLLLSNGITAVGLNGVMIDSGAVLSHGDFSYGVYGAATEGVVTVTSGMIEATGMAGGGIGGYGRDGVVIDSGSISISGQASYTLDGEVFATSAGIAADTTHGDISVTSGEVSTLADAGVGIFARAVAGRIDIDSGTISTAGDGAAGILAETAGDIDIQAGTTTTVGDWRAQAGSIVAGPFGPYIPPPLSGLHADAIHAESIDGGVSIVSGQVSAAGLGARGIHAEGATDVSIVAASASVTGDSVTLADEIRLPHAIFASSTGGDIDIEVTGAVSSAEASGIHAEAATGAAAIRVASGASVSGALSAINVEAAGGATIVNAGSITATGDGPAIQLTAGDDTVTLQTGSVITGAVLGGAGVNVAHLDGAGTTATEAQTLAHFVDFGQLNVDAGYWTASGDHASAFETVTIAAGAGLEVRDFLVDGEYEYAVGTGAVVNNGVLALNLTGGAEDTDGLSVTGAGAVVLNGSGTVYVTGDSIAHTGGTIVDAGKLIVTTGSLQGDLVINQEGTFQIGDGGTVGSFGGDILDNGELIFNRSDAYEFTGALTGSGSLVKMGGSQLFVSGEYGFTGTTTVLGGTLKLANIDPDAELKVGGGTLNLSGGDHEVAGLSGDGGEVNVEDGSLTVNTTGTSEFGGSITGSGDLTVSGDGTMNLIGNNTYTGTTTIEGGTLKVNGSIVSDVFIETGGSLGGNGTVADVDVGSGGTVGPGNSIGLLNVAGDIAFGPGSFYEVEVNAAGQSDRIVATGEAELTGGTVQVLAEAGTYNRLTTYNILSAAGGVDGEFDAVTTNFAYLTASLDYTSNDVLLTLARNDIAFATLAQGANQTAVAGAVEAGGGDLFDAVLFQSDAGAQEAFTTLSGEFYGAASTALLAQSRYSREATLDRLRDAEGGAGAWVAAYGAHQTWDAGEAAAARNNLGGVMLGADVGVGAWRVGAAVGQERSRTKTPALASRSETETTTVAGYGGFGAGALSARVGLSHAMHDIEADREVTFPNFMDATTADVEGTTTQLFGEVGYKMPLVGGTFEPFANLALARVRTDAFTETGGASALEVDESEREVVFSSVGARFTVEVQLPVGVASPYLSLAYGNASGDTEGVSGHAFDTGEAFTATGASLNDNAILLDTGFDWRIGDNAEAGFGYQGSFGDEADEQSVRVEFSLKF